MSAIHQVSQESQSTITDLSFLLKVKGNNGGKKVYFTLKVDSITFTSSLFEFTDSFNPVNILSVIESGEHTNFEFVTTDCMISIKNGKFLVTGDNKIEFPITKTIIDEFTRIIPLYTTPNTIFGKSYMDDLTNSVLNSQMEFIEQIKNLNDEMGSDEDSEDEFFNEKDGVPKEVVESVNGENVSEKNVIEEEYVPDNSSSEAVSNEE